MTWNSTLKRKTPMRRAAMKATSKRKAATKAERSYMSAQADAGCILCRHLGLGATPAEIHHLRHGVGAGQRNSHRMSIPLCPEHHRGATGYRSEEHTSELQSRENLVCRLLLEKNKPSQRI